jgi:hypothetical protein
MTQRGDTTPFSLENEVAIVTVNTAPVLNAAGSPAFTAVAAGTAASAIRGNSVAELLARLSPGGSISDADASAMRGIAVNAVAGSTSGRWQYSLNGGTSWLSIGTVSSSSALLLAADSQTRVRFLPNAGFAGNVSLRFAAWDRTSGVNGTRASLSVRGGSSAFSLSDEVASLSVLRSSARMAALDALFSSDLAFAE